MCRATPANGPGESQNPGAVTCRRNTPWEKGVALASPCYRREPKRLLGRQVRGQQRSALVLGCGASRRNQREAHSRGRPWGLSDPPPDQGRRCSGHLEISVKTPETRCSQQGSFQPSPPLPGCRATNIEQSTRCSFRTAQRESKWKNRFTRCHEVAHTAKEHKKMTAHAHWSD